jgi:hypothetical protein
VAASTAQIYLKISGIGLVSQLQVSARILGVRRVEIDSYAHFRPIFLELCFCRLVFIAEPLGLATQEKIDFVHQFLISLSCRIGHRGI